MLSKVLSILLTVDPAKWLKNKKNKKRCQCPRARKRIFLSSRPIWRAAGQRGGGEAEEGRRGRKGRGRSRDSLLMSIWWVFSWSRDLFVLLLFPESSIPPSLCERGPPAQRTRCRCSVRLVKASCQRRLIGSSRIDPRSFPYLNCDLILLSGPLDMYLNAMLPYYTKKWLVKVLGSSSKISLCDVGRGCPHV